MENNDSAKKRQASSQLINTAIDLDTISKIIHRIGHDIGNPLTSIISLASIIEKFSDPRFNSLDPAKLSSYAGTIANEAWKISRLSECLVQTLSQRTVQLQEVRLEDVIDRALTKIESAFSKHDNIKVTVEMPDELVVLAEQDQLTFAVSEIIRNAFQACIEFDLNDITISAENVDSYCKISCSNQLQAPIEGELAELFLPLVSQFKKISTPGLGLHTVATILKRLDGYCEIEEINDTEFKVNLYVKTNGITKNS